LGNQRRRPHLDLSPARGALVQRRPVRAGDFVYAWRRTVDPRTASDYAEALAPVRNALAIALGKMPVTALGISAPDERTVRVELNAPTPFLLSLLTKSYRAAAIRTGVPRARRGLGAPRVHRQQRRVPLQEYVIGGRVTLVKNPQYWNAAQVRLEKIVYCSSTAPCRPTASLQATSPSPIRFQPSRPRGCARGSARRWSAHRISATSCWG
jgi:ABC-type transport system substrate-binding protein